MYCTTKKKMAKIIKDKAKKNATKEVMKTSC